MTISYGRELAVDTRMVKAAAARVQEAIDAADSEVPLHETLLMVVGRGASDPDANSNVSKITRMLWEGFGFGWAETCYSGVTFPLVGPGLEHAAKLGYKRVIVFPYFLFTGVLVQRIYSTTDEVAAKHPEIEFLKAGYLNDHPQVIDTMADRVQEILQGANLMNCQMCKYREQVLASKPKWVWPRKATTITWKASARKQNASCVTRSAPEPAKSRCRRVVIITTTMVIIITITLMTMGMITRIIMATLMIIRTSMGIATGTGTGTGMITIITTTPTRTQTIRTAPGR